MFNAYRERGKDFISISGPYEFLADDPFLYGIHAPENMRNKLPPAPDARVALAAYNHLRADIGWLSAKASRWLRESGGSPPANYQVVSSEPVARILDTPVGKIGVVLFPEGKEPGNGPAAAQEEQVLAAGRALKDKVRLLIGVSPWGYVGERDFLPKAGGIYGCIMGGGEGVGFDYSLKENPSVLWLRPDSQGRAVNILELLELPPLGAAPKWKEGATFRAYLEFLDDSYPSDPGMLQIVGRPSAN